MIQTVAIEEAVLHPGHTDLSTRYIPADRIRPGGRPPVVDALIDIHGNRLDLMNEYGNEFQVLSLTSPGPQGETDVKKAEELARECNDWIAEEVKKNPKRFGAFCSLSMHNPEQAAKELRRSVKELGLVGAILNDWQSTGEDGNGMLLYDGEEFDPFWKEVEELDVPIYFHPKVFLSGRLM
jgi:2,3-dihydroxybenzoate decarboxylase